LPKSRKLGFTLVELSIVLLIIGLIIGGITAGSSLIKQASIRAVISDINLYITSINSFKLQYNAYPGDFGNATSFWPTSGNGNADGRIQYSETVTGNGPEWLRAWQHLSLAGLLSYSITYSGTMSQSSIPASKVNNLYWTMGYDGPLYSAGQGNFLESTSGLGSLDTYNIDSKIDDGLAPSGKLLGLAPNPYVTGHCVTAVWTTATASYIIPDPNSYSDCRIFQFIP
jgi:prepilin-type N-terminal cleavage/methylation domain-containing protein